MGSKAAHVHFFPGMYKSEAVSAWMAEKSRYSSIFGNCPIHDALGACFALTVLPST
jgi:hypothetical protein